MKSFNLQHYDDFKSIMQKVIENLKNSEKRIRVERSESCQVLRDILFQPDTETVMASDYGISSGNEEIEKDYFDEVLLIEKVVEKENVPIKLADWQNGKGGKGVFTSLNRRSIAVQLWERYAIPVRCKGDQVFIIRPSQDVLGKPMIACYNTEDALALVGDKLSRLELENSKQSKKINWYLSILVLFCFLLYAALAFNFSILSNVWLVGTLFITVGALVIKQHEKYKQKLN